MNEIVPLMQWWSVRYEGLLSSRNMAGSYSSNGARGPYTFWLEATAEDVAVVFVHVLVKGRTGSVFLVLSNKPPSYIARGILHLKKNPLLKKIVQR